MQQHLILSDQKSMQLTPTNAENIEENLLTFECTLSSETRNVDSECLEVLRMGKTKILFCNQVLESVLNAFVYEEDNLSSTRARHFIPFCTCTQLIHVVTVVVYM